MCHFQRFVIFQNAQSFSVMSIIIEFHCYKLFLLGLVFFCGWGVFVRVSHVKLLFFCEFCFPGATCIVLCLFCLGLQTCLCMACGGCGCGS